MAAILQTATRRPPAVEVVGDVLPAMMVSADVGVGAGDEEAGDEGWG